MVVCGWTTSKYHESFAKVNFKVRLASEIMASGYDHEHHKSSEASTFQSSGKSTEKLFTEAAKIVNRFYIGSWILGLFVGLVFGLTLAKHTLIQYRTDYTTNKGTCFSCARCVDYCPVKKEETKQGE